MPYRLEIAGAPPPVDLPSWQDPKFVSEPVGMTPEAIWNQALSEYEARLKKPRTDVWGNTLAEDRPEALDRSIMAPLRAQFGIPEPKSPWSGPIEMAGGKVIQVNTQTGDARVVASGQPKKTLIHSKDLGVLEVDDQGNVRKLVEPTPASARTDNAITVRVPELAQDIPPSLGQPAQPAVAGTGLRGFLGLGKPSIPAKPAVEARPGEKAHPPYSYRLNIGTNDPSRAFTIPMPAGAPAPSPLVPAAAARSPVLDTSVPTYGSENEARAAGLKAGAVVYLVGVGKVRLE